MVERVAGHASHLNRVKSAQTVTRLIGGDVDGRREKDDFYATPPEATRALLSVETFDGPILEPSCGDGAICRELQSAGYDVLASDLVDRGYGQTGLDFLMPGYPLSAPNVVGNPPFKLAVPFVRKSLEIASRKSAWLLKLAFLEGRERAAFFAEAPLARVWVFSNRLPFVRGGGEVLHGMGGGMMCFAWFVFEHGHVGAPQLGWLDGGKFSDGALAHPKRPRTSKPNCGAVADLFSGEAA